MNIELFTRLCAPFDNLKERPLNDKPGARLVKYITPRHVQNRLDDVMGPLNWWAKYTAIDAECVRCELTLFIEDSDGARELTKHGIGVGKNPKDASSDAIKVAAVQFGIARYLHDAGVPHYAKEVCAGHLQPSSRPSTNGHTNGNGQAPQNGQGNAKNSGGYPISYDCPKHGRALFAWAKERENEFKVGGAMKAVDNHKEIKDVFPYKWNDWDDDQVRFGYNVMVAFWKKNGVWPTQRGEPERSEPALEDFGPPPDDHDVGPAPVSLAELEPVKVRIRAAAVAMHTAKNGQDAPPLKYPGLLKLANWFAKNKCGYDGEEITNLTDCRDSALLKNLADKMEAMAAVETEKAEKARVAALDDDIPF